MSNDDTAPATKADVQMILERMVTKDDLRKTTAEIESVKDDLRKMTAQIENVNEWLTTIVDNLANLDQKISRRLDDHEDHIRQLQTAV